MTEDFSFKNFKNSFSTKFKNNKKFKIGTYALSSILILIAGCFAYYQFIYVPENNKSKNAYWKGLNYAVNDTVPDRAIKELKKVSTKYDGKDGGEIAQFVLARQYMRKGDYKKAISSLEEVKLTDTYLSRMKIGLIGDCHSELKKYAKASEFYQEAADIENGNEFISPMYLFKAAQCAEKLKNYDKATELYKKIKVTYSSYEKENIDKYIAKASNTKVK